MKTALITGASSGMGLEYSRQLAAIGYDIIVVSNREEENKTVARMLHLSYGVRTYPLYCDLTKNDAAEKIYDWIHQQELLIDVLVSNAGILQFGLVKHSSLENLEKITQLHCLQPAKLLYLVGGDMIKRHFGYILVVSSVSAWTKYPTIAMYSATKAFLRNLSESLWFEYRMEGVSVTTVYPGAVDTPLYSLDDSKRKWLLRFGVMLSAQNVAKKALRGMFKKKRRVVPGIFNRLSLFLVCITPAWLILLIMRIPPIRCILKKA
ncbi:MAG: SDR family NAD(P)-dependent oxidoreductase [Alistipes sp.]|nr:SDR family NAD(P)-dependent oxidoreductase [Candidatus Alistipes equi]